MQCSKTNFIRHFLILFYSYLHLVSLGVSSRKRPALGRCAGTILNGSRTTLRKKRAQRLRDDTPRETKVKINPTYPTPHPSAQPSNSRNTSYQFDTRALPHTHLNIPLRAA